MTMNEYVTKNNILSNYQILLVLLNSTRLNSHNKLELIVDLTRWNLKGPGEFSNLTVYCSIEKNVPNVSIFNSKHDSFRLLGIVTHVMILCLHWLRQLMEEVLLLLLAQAQTVFSLTHLEPQGIVVDGVIL